MAASGAQHVIRCGELAATVTEVGAGLRTLTAGDRDLVVPYAAADLPAHSQGAVLVPWPNRIPHGRYSFDGVTHQFPINEVRRGCAIHGFASWLPWTLLGATASAVRLTTELWPRPGYPFHLSVEAVYALDGSGLTWTLTATNLGDSDAPYGVSVHPYLVAGAGGVDDWTMRSPGTRVLTVDDSLVPTGSAPADPSFAAGHPLTGIVLDTAYTDLPGGDVSAELRAADGTGVALDWDADLLPYVQVFTSDIAGWAHKRGAVAIEPMSCPANGFNTGEGLVRLAPGGRHAAWWRIRPIEG